ncbi:hypothetical protein, partial [Polaromonas sp. JS666]|uniref:hypothetical protein n=1 Tax=Polaromonas sp. (strain JS666 / ATCC BAA-500) TaxID=296591 RepID=UPI001C31E384
ARTGQSGAGTENQEDKYKQGHAMACPCFFRYSGFCLRLFGIPVPTPLWMRRGAQGQTDQGKNLFEPKASCF